MHSCRTIDSLSSLLYLPYFICEKNCNYPPESLEKSVQIEKDWKWAPLAAEKTLSILNRSLPGLCVLLCWPFVFLPQTVAAFVSTPTKGV